MKKYTITVRVREEMVKVVVKRYTTERHISGRVESRKDPLTEVKVVSLPGWKRKSRVS